MEQVADMDPESQNERPETVTTGLCPEQGWAEVHRSHEEDVGPDRAGESSREGGLACQRQGSMAARVQKAGTEML